MGRDSLKWDVVVVGGGVAGVAAALAAARSGMEVLLVEKGVQCGGLATTGLIVHYLPLCDGRGRKVMGGIAEELLYLSIKYGKGTLSEEWRQEGDQCDTDERYQTWFNPAAFVLALDEALEEAGVDVLYDTLLCGVEMDGGRVSGLVVENKGGRQVLSGDFFVDASGDADLFVHAGAGTELGDNYPVIWALTVGGRRTPWGEEHPLGVTSQGYGSMGGRMQRELPKDVAPRQMTDGFAVSDFVRECRDLLRTMLPEMEEGKTLHTTLPGMPMYRMTRRVCGWYTLTGEDVFRAFEDSVGCISDWRKAGPVYEVPLRALCAAEVENAAVAGRCISASGEGWEVARCIPQAAATGQAAGTAAALAVRSGRRAHEVDVGKLQQRLSDDGVVLRARE